MEEITLWKKRFSGMSQGLFFLGFHSLAFIQNIFLSFDPLLKDLLKDLAVAEIHTPDEGV